jgi:DNA-binding transcriptional regulator GbsR (MarR family)
MEPSRSDPPPEGLDVHAALDEVERDFIDLWRSMASLWGISPTMAQIHGLLFITAEVLSTDDIMARLNTSRGNVSMNLTRLVEWGLVRRVHRRGDRRDYYESHGDVWEMFTVVATQRKRRELDPMISALRRCGERLAPEQLGDRANDDRAASRRQRVADLLAFLGLVDFLAQRFFENHTSLRAALELLTQKDGKS